MVLDGKVGAGREGRQVTSIRGCVVVVVCVCVFSVQRCWAAASSPLMMVEIFAAKISKQGEGARERERAEFSIALWRKRFKKGFVPIHNNCCCQVFFNCKICFNSFCTDTPYSLILPTIHHI